MLSFGKNTRSCTYFVPTTLRRHDEIEIAKKIKYIAANYGLCKIVLCDTIERHTIEARGIKNPYDVALECGDIWIKKRGFILGGLDNVHVNIVRWDYYLNIDYSSLINEYEKRTFQHHIKERFRPYLYKYKNNIKQRVDGKCYESLYEKYMMELFLAVFFELIHPENNVIFNHIICE